MPEAARRGVLAGAGDKLDAMRAMAWELNAQLRGKNRNIPPDRLACA